MEFLLDFFQLLRTAGFSSSGRNLYANGNLIGWRSPIIVPVLISANQFEWTETTWLNIQESSCSLILSEFYTVLNQNMY